MGTEATVHFVCVRAAHHRRGTTAGRLCEYLGHPAYCPAGDAAGHDWMVTSTDLGALARLGYVVERDGSEKEKESDAVDEPPVLIRV